ncbi:hypothetical protein Syun_020723 [Stephania yunnanensis]|uniref:Uncharacterized protein n=1 Tax=Stephania yunnanensis TaxID=152371 RepID=A0AAP0IFM5_9MAGN
MSGAAELQLKGSGSRRRRRRHWPRCDAGSGAAREELLVRTLGEQCGSNNSRLAGWSNGM